MENSDSRANLHNWSILLLESESFEWLEGVCFLNVIDYNFVHSLNTFPFSGLNTRKCRGTRNPIPMGSMGMGISVMMR